MTFARDTYEQARCITAGKAAFKGKEAITTCPHRKRSRKRRWWESGWNMAADEVLDKYFQEQPMRQILGFTRKAWTGGSTPPPEIKADVTFRALRREYFRESLRECGGLDLWKCAGTSSMERARIFWSHAAYDAWATMRRPGTIADGPDGPEYQ